MTSPFSFTAKTDGVDDHLAAHVNALQLAADVLAKSPNGTLFNGKIVVSVTSNNITVALKTVDGNNPSASDPVYVRVGDVIRPLTVALSVTKNAGTNWFNSGSAELATKEIDYFVYIIWNTTPATDILDIGFARIPYANLYSDFSATTTNEKYLANGNASAPNPANDIVLIGRFAATLSAAAGHNWSVPAFTSNNLIQRPIYHTRWLSWTPAYSASGSLTYTTVATAYANYMVDGKNVLFKQRASGTLGGTASTEIRFTLPFEIAFTTGAILAPAQWADAASGFGGVSALAGTPDIGRVLKYNDGNWSTSGTGVIQSSGSYEIE